MTDVFDEIEMDAQEPGNDMPIGLRLLEAILFAAAEPLDVAAIAALMPAETPVEALLHELQGLYEPRGVNLVQVAGKWMLRTAPDLAPMLEKHKTESRKLSRAALDTLAIIAYHQPVTRAEIEQIRGVSLSKGTLDLLLETAWVRMRGRRRVPGRPITYGTTEAFLTHFQLADLSDLPGVDDMKAAGLLDLNFQGGVPNPRNGEGLAPDEDPLEDNPEDEMGPGSPVQDAAE